MFCTNCGAEIRAGAKFCENCGTRVEILPESHVQPAEQPEAAAPETAAAAGSAAAPEPAPNPEHAPAPELTPEPAPAPEPAAAPESEPTAASEPAPEPAPGPAPQSGSYTDPGPGPQSGSYTDPGPAPQGGPYQQKPAGSGTFSEKILELINPGHKMSGMSIAAIVFCILNLHFFGALLGIIDISRDRTNRQYTHWLSAAAIAIWIIFFILGIVGYGG